MLRRSKFLEHIQWRIQRGFNGFHGTALLKCCLRKYYAQTYYVHYTHTRAMHFSFTVAVTPLVSTHVSRIRRAHDLRARINCQKHMTTIETMSEARERTKAKVLFMHCSICSWWYAISMRALIFPRLMQITQAAMQPLRPKVESRLWFCGPQTQQLGLVVARSSNFWQFHSKNTLETISEGLSCGGGEKGGMPPAPSSRCTCALYSMGRRLCQNCTWIWNAAYWLEKFINVPLHL